MRTTLRDNQGRLHCEDGPAVYYSDGSVEVWYWHGKIHRKGGPAYKYGSSIKWYRHGRLHRLDGPAVETYYEKSWWKDGRRHRDKDLPAEIQYSTHGRKRIHRRRWYKNGYLHRDNDKPAEIMRDRSIWYTNGYLHRDNDKPAVINNNYIHREYWKNGIRHRSNGPSYIGYNYEHNMWHFEGEDVTDKVNEVRKTYKFKTPLSISMQVFLKLCIA